MVKTVLPIQRAQVQSLVRLLRFYMSWGTAKRYSIHTLTRVPAQSLSHV